MQNEIQHNLGMSQKIKMWEPVAATGKIHEYGWSNMQS